MLSEKKERGLLSQTTMDRVLDATRVYLTQIPWRQGVLPLCVASLALKLIVYHDCKDER